MTRFLCFGDVHLGAGSDLGREPGDRLSEQEDVLWRIAELAVELDATPLFAGDAWERRRPTPAEILAWKRPLAGLEASLVGVAGNHDVEAFGRPTGYDVLDYEVATKPDHLWSAGAWIARLPWAPPGHLVALEGGGDRDELNERLARGLVQIARGLFADMPTSAPRILVAHWSVGGATTPAGAPVDLFREPVLDVAELAAIGFDAIVLGHIHRPQMLSRADEAPIFYVGSPMPLNFGEATSEHVVWLLDVEQGRPAQAFQIPIESRPLVEVTLDVVRGDDPRLALERGDEYGRDCLRRALGPVSVDGAIVKVKARGSAEAARRWDLVGLKRNLEALGALKVWAIQPEIERAALVRGPAMDADVDDDDALRAWLDLAELPAGVTVEELLDLHRSYVSKAAA